jgi:hypothetical protein
MKVHFPLNHVHVSNSNRTVQNQVYKVCTLNHFLLDEFVGIIFFFQKKALLLAFIIIFFFYKITFVNLQHTHTQIPKVIYTQKLA